MNLIEALYVGSSRDLNVAPLHCRAPQLYRLDKRGFIAEAGSLCLVGFSVYSLCIEHSKEATRRLRADNTWTGCLL